MADVEERCPDIADPLRLERCPDCGYMLCGLPERGVCPECGFAYGPEMIVLYGWEQGMAPDHRRWLRVAQRIVRYWWVVYVAMLLWLEPWAMVARAPSLWGVTVLVLLLAPLAVALWQHLRGGPVEGPAPVQLRLLPEGFSLRDGIGPAELRPWHRRMGIGFEPIRDDWYLLYSEFDGQRVVWWPGLEIKCDEITAKRVRQRVVRWCGQAPDEPRRPRNTENASEGGTEGA